MYLDLYGSLLGLYGRDPIGSGVSGKNRYVSNRQIAIRYFSVHTSFETSLDYVRIMYFGLCMGVCVS